MPYLNIDRISTLSYVERNGVINSMMRQARIVWNTGTEAPPLDFTVLSEAMTLLDTQGIVFGSALDNNLYRSLVLVERAPSLGPDKNCVDVNLKYEHVLAGPNQQLINGFGILYGKGKTSIVEKTTNFFYPPGLPRTEDNRTQILVAHVFPDGDMGIAGMPLVPGLPRTVIQGGEVSVPFPQENFSLVGYISTVTPRAVANEFVAKISSNTWLGRPPLTWICSEVQWEILSLEDVELPALGFPPPPAPLYKFQFEFQYNIDTWNPTVAFLDQRTGRPPAGVVDERAFILDANNVNRLRLHPFPPGGIDTTMPAGIWQVPSLEQVDFNTLFGAFFEGLEP